ncbi:hypothetical protein BJ165DRAFT_1352678, partial [Panaeolus papilionaceus]
MNNPVAAARFFHVLVQLVIKHVLCFNDDNNRHGLYGKTSAYYGTVEQQGRLTLHLHMMVWIEGSISPQQIKDRFENDDSDFTINLIKYLESAHTGDFLTGNLNTVQENVSQHMTENDYIDPIRTLPTPSIGRTCEHKYNDDYCLSCERLGNWWEQNFKPTVDDIVYKSNVHTCRTLKETNALPNNNGNYNGAPKGCLDKNNICRARFPRTLYKESHIDEDGHLNLKKSEEMINTYTPILSYLLRCNLDVTCLMSGTAMKATVSYITDYITKFSLKSHHIFSSMLDIYQK